MEIPNRKSQGKPFNGEGASIERKRKMVRKSCKLFVEPKNGRSQAAEGV